MILSVSKNSSKPFISFNKGYEVDELCTYIGIRAIVSGLLMPIAEKANRLLIL
jgi:hypothetical protein